MAIVAGKGLFPNMGLAAQPLLVQCCMCLDIHMHGLPVMLAWDSRHCLTPARTNCVIVWGCLTGGGMLPRDRVPEAVGSGGPS